ncbi:MAG: YvcK family protein [Bacilli bacterium]
MHKKVTVLGGGTGISYLLKGLKDFPVDITAIITVSDNGKSTGVLREEFHTPAVGDIRKVISNLSGMDNEIKDIFEYRFKTSSDLDGHTIGNLLLTGFIDMTGSLKKSIDNVSKLLDVRHKVLPLSEECLTLMGETMDGKIIEGESNITEAKQKYKRIFYKKEPKVLDEVIDAIINTDLIIISMGSLYTSIFPHLISKQVALAMKLSKAKIMYLCNAMTQPGETDNYTVSDHIKELNKHLIKRKIDVVIASNTKISNEMLKKYETKEQKDQVVIDEEKINKIGCELITGDLLTDSDGTLKHNSLKLSTLVFNYLMRD